MLKMPRIAAKNAAQHRFSHGIAAAKGECDPRTRSLAVELLCNAFPTGAVVLDGSCQVIFANSEGSELLVRWTNKPGRWQNGTAVPPEIIGACDRLRLGRPQPRGRGERPKFGGRVFVRNASDPSLSAVVALERSRRDRRVAVFCVLIQDRLKDSLATGRKDHLAMLTIAERRVAKLAAEGLRNSEIATGLGKSITTVKSQLGAVFAKLQVVSRTQLAALLRSV